MATDRKMARLDKLSPELRKQVEEEIDREVRADRLRTLLEGNSRLLDAFAAVWADGVDRETEPGSVAVGLVVDVVEAERPEAKAKADAARSRAERDPNG